MSDIRVVLRRLYEAVHGFLDVHGYPALPGPETPRLNAALREAFEALGTGAPDRPGRRALPGGGRAGGAPPPARRGTVMRIGADGTVTVPDPEVVTTLDDDDVHTVMQALLLSLMYARKHDDRKGQVYLEKALEKFRAIRDSKVEDEP